MAYNTYRKSQRKKSNTGRINDNYIDGNTVRKLNVVEEIHNPIDRKEKLYSNQRNQRQALYMNLGYVVFLIGALIMAAMILMSYIRLQADIIIAVENIASMESQLNDLKLSNDENYARASSSVDLEEVRRVAIGELGMKYAKEGQIINVSGHGTDYVRQLAQIRE